MPVVDNSAKSTQHQGIKQNKTRNLRLAILQKAYKNQLSELTPQPNTKREREKENF